MASFKKEDARKMWQEATYLRGLADFVDGCRKLEVPECSWRLRDAVDDATALLHTHASIMELQAVQKENE